jgi:hypothetical protein
VPLALAACAPAGAKPTATPAATAEPTGLVSPTPTPEPTVATQYYVRQTYTAEANGLKLDYPADWTASPNTQIGSRGEQALLLSPGTTAETLPEGGSRVSITLYRWDPEGDLASYVTQRRTAWDASGFTIVVEKRVT